MIISKVDIFSFNKPKNQYKVHVHEVPTCCSRPVPFWLVTLLILLPNGTFFWELCTKNTIQTQSTMNFSQTQIHKITWKGFNFSLRNHFSFVVFVLLLQWVFYFLYLSMIIHSFVQGMENLKTVIHSKIKHFTNKMSKHYNQF
jgi:hypothetical protein